MNRDERHLVLRAAALAAGAVVLLATTPAGASITGVEGTSFDLVARADHVSSPDGGSLLSWGYALGTGRMQYPGPTLILREGDTVTVTLQNQLPASAGNVSVLFPGLTVSATGGVAGALAREAPPDGTTVVTYTLTNLRPGTYQYHSGTRPELQVEMGLLGAIVVRPAGFGPAARTAYGDAGSRFDREYLFILSEMDPRIHSRVMSQGPAGLANRDYLTNYFANYWFLNGRNAPDSMARDFAPWLPTQPYGALARMHPGERVLMRVVGAGRDVHPFHHHGAHARVIARDGRRLVGPGGQDLSHQVFTITSIPGETVDAVFEWTGRDLGWDIYGTGPGREHDCTDGDADGFDDATREWCADHGRAIPVDLPEQQSLTFGGHYSGSPFLGSLWALPTGEGGMNPDAAYTYMWHSHTEKELTNYDIFPGGMMTMMFVEAPWVTIE